MNNRSALPELGSNYVTRSGRVCRSSARLLSSSSPPPAAHSEATTLPTSIVDDDGDDDGAVDRHYAEDGEDGLDEVNDEDLDGAIDEELDAESVLEHPQAIFEVPDSGGPAPVIAKLERIIGSIADSILMGSVLSIPLQTRTARKRRPVAADEEDDAEEAPAEAPVLRQTAVRFPGRDVHEARRFAQVQKIIQHAHKALIDSVILSKRNIYYQDQWLFGEQRTVDRLVDDLALTLRVGRDDLNIVAAGKGMISGHLRFLERGPRATWSDCRTGSDIGVLVPPLRTLRRVDISEAKWILVIEKEATFRTLSARRYWDHARLGPGILVTGKGYADLATRQLLGFIHSLQPGMPMFALVDYDPHGIKILRTLMYNSQSLGHEENITVPNIRWLGICGHHLLTSIDQDAEDGSQAMENRLSDFGSSPGFAASSSGLRFQTHAYVWGTDTGHNLRPRKRARHGNTSSRKMHENVVPLTDHDWKTAVRLLEAIYDQEEQLPAEEDQAHQLRMMLMLNIKAEIQAVDSYGDLSRWLDENLHLE